MEEIIALAKELQKKITEANNKAGWGKKGFIYSINVNATEVYIHINGFVDESNAEEISIGDNTNHYYKTIDGVRYTSIEEKDNDENKDQ